ncbi:phosphatidylcholine/phosphatidylserine synthase [Tenacibaculum sp. UWU-22]|uniref:CDP-alcohol phosphatidyltransferase family protein n=1 Tax=Tenacibaculum sp. UWU-22 TaxID=3234187 RepID=UPI0034DB6469
MNLKKQLPNLLTFANLFCGTVAIIFAIKGDFEATAILVALGIVFDFFDGFTARLLHVHSELGKQLDSLADMVTSGVVPGIVMLQLLINSIDKDAVGYFGTDPEGATGSMLPYIGLLLTLAAAYRLAKFNIDSRQTNHFIGLPTPAMNLLVVSLPLIIEYSPDMFFVNLVQRPYFLITTTIILSFLMNAELSLFSLKFTGFSFKKNGVKYVFLALCLVLLLILKFVAVPFIILLYIVLSIINTLRNKAI